MQEQDKLEAIGIEKSPTGIDGFDEISGGGLPCNRTTLIAGGSGSGKTVFALQTLVNGARMYNEPGIFVALEENSRQIIANAATFGWDLPALERDRLFFLDARMSSETITTGNFDLSGLLAGLTAKAKEMKANRIVFDSLGVLLTLMDDPAVERQELYRVHDWLSHSGMTGILTARMEGEQLDRIQRYDFLQFMADCIILLHHHVLDRVSLRELRVAKYRGSSFSENAFPMLISSNGIEVFSLGNLSREYAVSSERVSTGIEHLDEMLDGGYYRGSTTLITGTPGTAKSTLCGAFVQAACQRGEKALYVSFDEAAQEIVRNLTSVDIDLAPCIESGQLNLHSAHTDDYSAEEHLMKIRNWIELYKPRCLVIDPLSAMLKAGGQLSALSATRRLLYLTKSQGITLVATSLTESIEPLAEATRMQVSTLADNWIHVSYVIMGGERNRALTIIKSRGTAHSNQVRELVLSDQGITLKEVYSAGGEVLMGTLRWEKEAVLAQEQERIRQEVGRKRKELEQAEIEVQGQIAALQHELKARQDELNQLLQNQEDQERDWVRWRSDVRQRRSGGSV